MAVSNLDIADSLLAHVLIYIIFNRELADGGQWIGHIDAQTVLMAVQRIDSHY